MQEVSLHVLVWNDHKDLPELIRSIRALTYPNIHVRMLDNGSSDESLAYLRKHVPEWLVACNTRNLGFAAGHNQLMRIALHRWEGEDLSEKYILAVNADMILDPGFIEPLLEPFTDDHVGATQPKIFRVLRQEHDREGYVKTQMIDTTGLVLGKSLRMEDRGAGKEDTGEFDMNTDIFGAAGALPCYRASALVDAAEGDAYFDEDFFAYREDCDLAFRLRRRGWKVVFCPRAHVWHFRSMYGAEKRSLLQRLRDRKGQSRFSSAYSTRNQLFFLIKNFPLGAWKLLPHVLFHEGGRLIYSLLFERETRKVVFRALTTVPNMYKKRKALQEKDRIFWKDIAPYVGN